MKPTLEDDSFTDKAIAQAACNLVETDNGITNAVSLLIRQLDVRGDESGNHPGETFVMAMLTREELHEIVDWLDNDWAAQLKVTPDISPDSTYPMPVHGWTCFHCGETFLTVGTARDHFGADQSAKPGCMMKVSLGAERGLLMALRTAEERIARYMEEDTILHRDRLRMQGQHSDALRIAEEAGYERGLRDGREATARL